MKKLKLFLAIAAIVTLASCVKEPDFELSDGNRIPMNIDGSISQVPTKATAQGFVDKDAVGLFAVNYIDNNTVAGTLLASGNQADNVKYVFDEPNQKWTPMRSVYYKDVNTNVDIYLYYPYQSDISDVNESNFEVKKDQSVAATETALSGYEASDFLWGKVENVTPTESKVRIPLSHRLSAVQVTLVEGTGFETGEFESISKSVILTNTTRKAKIDFATGTATALGQPQLDGIVMCPQEGGEFRAIVIPQSVDANTKLFAITLDGISYSFKQNAATSYQAGKQTNVAITLNKKTPGGDYELTLGSTTIVDWTEDRNTHGGEARQYFVVNVETPGTLGETITAMGKNPAKIRNLKVTGQVNGIDFYFMRDEMTILEAVNMKEAKIVAGQSESYYSWQSRNKDNFKNEDDELPEYSFSQKKTLYTFTFPEIIIKIGASAFAGSGLSGALIIPNDVEVIGSGAFSYTNISTLSFNQCLSIIESDAFSNCRSLTGDLVLPESVKEVGGNAFFCCVGFSGRLSIPKNIEKIGDYAFSGCGSFVGDFVVPDNITVYNSFIAATNFSGQLDLNNVTSFVQGNSYLYGFESCGFSGDLIIPEGITEIPGAYFRNNKFTNIVFPSSLKKISGLAFYNCSNVMGDLSLPEGLVVIEQEAFAGCNHIERIYLPSTIQTIQGEAFAGNSGVSCIICDAVEPPSIGSGAFNGISKDNCSVEVADQSVIRYQTEMGWRDFKRIAAHYDFALNRHYMRALNRAQSRTYVLRAPAGFDWSVDAENLPDWITVSPMSGTGKTDVTISVSEMARTNDTFEVNEGTFNNPSYKNYKGRSGEVIFKLDEKDYTFTFDVEQYDYDYPDGYVQTLHTATVGPGIDFVFTGDGYDARDIAKGTFADNASAGYNHLFDIEPYKTYKDYFNVYAVTAQSDDSGIGTVNTVKDSKFSSRFTQNRILCENPDAVFAWAKKADASMDLCKSLVILLMNSSIYEGICYMYGDGSALACCPVSANAYPYDFRGIIQHEAGGHGFGKLADEYIYHNAYIQNCECEDGCDHPQSDEDLSSSFGFYKSLGWFQNLSMKGDARQVPWAHLIYHPQYSNYVDMYEGGYMHSRGIYRSEATSCMNNNIPYYSAISRQAIVERIKAYAGEEFSLDDFYAHDSRAVGTKAGQQEIVDRTFGVDPLFHRGSGEDVIYMGEHPNVQ